MTPPPDHQLTALQVEIVRAGEQTRRLRLRTGRWIAYPLLALLVSGDLAVVGGAQPAPALTLLFQQFFLPLGSALLIAGTLAVLLAWPAAAAFRRVQYGRLRRRLAALSVDRRQEILAPLGRERGDAGKIVAPLIREFGIPTELTPASAPAGRGDEASPAW